MNKGKKMRSYDQVLQVSTISEWFFFMCTNMFIYIIQTRLLKMIHFTPFFLGTSLYQYPPLLLAPASQLEVEHSQQQMTQRTSDIHTIEVSARQMDVSENSGTPKWMVYNGKPYSNGWFGGTIIFGNIQMWVNPFQETSSFAMFVCFCWE